MHRAAADEAVLANTMLAVASLPSLTLFLNLVLKTGVFFQVNALFSLFLPECLGHLCCSPLQRQGASCALHNQNGFHSVIWCQQKTLVTGGFPYGH